MDAALTLHQVPPGFGAALAGALVEGLTPEARGRMLREMLTPADRQAVALALAREMTFYTAAEAGAKIGWTGRGFQMRATAENCPHLPGAANRPWLYSHPHVVALFDRLQVWPKGNYLTARAA